LGLAGNQHWLLPAITLVFMLYTLFGGQYAISYSDLFQIGFILVAILAVALPMLYWHDAGSALAPVSAQKLRFPVNESMPWPKALSLVFIIGFPHLVGSDIYAKILSSRDEATARQASYWAAAIRLLWGVGLGVFVLLAMAKIPQVHSLDKSAMLLPQSLTAFFSPFFAGLFLAALLAILMSSADTILMTAATVATLDLLPPTLSDKQKMYTGRAAIAALGLAALALALWAPGIIQTLELAYTVFAAGLSLPVLAGLFGMAIRPLGALLAMAGGGGTALALQLELLPDLGGEAIFWGLGVSFVILAAYAWPRRG
jgi:SSS family solute:Na+ symporter